MAKFKTFLHWWLFLMPFCQVKERIQFYGAMNSIPICLKQEVDRMQKVYILRVKIELLR